ncbi:uncharacterized protein LOC130734343 [Lotus japonicus]|uniref:uncharacterized protein LOC130734343 n=1 Tax=Lotus japonicus TaxID=34305 RepID=UPI00258D765F|nr:uncharacterized protein LOC130734343 [Lotus japonicus]
MLCSLEIEREPLSDQPPGGAVAGKPPEPPGPQARKPTFKEKVLGSEKAQEAGGFVNLVESGVMKKVYVEKNKSFPMFSIDPAAKAEICRPWEDCLVVKLLGKSIGYRALCEKLKILWKMTGGYEVRDVHHGYFLIKFDKKEDKERAISGAPWLIYDHYLAVKPWTPDFVAANSKISTTVVWIRIPGLGFQYYGKNILMMLASAVGTPIKVDMNTTDMQRGKYARICVEIDLNKPVLGVIGLEGTWYNVEYEGLHLLCHKCGCYGHLARNCTAPPLPKQPQGQATNGSASIAAMAEQVSDLSHETLASSNLAAGVAPATASATLAPVTDAIMGAISGHSIPDIKCPDLAHGDWLIVDKRRNKSKTNLNSKAIKDLAVKKEMTSKKEEKKGLNGGNKFSILATVPQKQQISSNSSMQFKALPSKTHPGASASVTNGKKRLRKDSATNNVPPPHAGSTSTILQAASNGARSVDMGGVPIHVATDGAYSTMALVSLGGARYQMPLDDNNQICSMSNVKDYARDIPFDPGAGGSMAIEPRKA